MGAHQRMARQEARWVLDSQVHVANGGPFSGLVQGKFYFPARKQGVCCGGMQKAQGDGPCLSSN